MCVTLSKRHKLNIKIIYRSILIVYAFLPHPLLLRTYRTEGKKHARQSKRLTDIVSVSGSVCFYSIWIETRHFCLRPPFISKQSFCIHNAHIYFPFFIYKLFLFLFFQIARRAYRLAWWKKNAAEINVSLTGFSSSFYFLHSFVSFCSSHCDVRMANIEFGAKPSRYAAFRLECFCLDFAHKSILRHTKI